MLESGQGTDPSYSAHETTNDSALGGDVETPQHHHNQQSTYSATTGNTTMMSGGSGDKSYSQNYSQQQQQQEYPAAAATAGDQTTNASSLSSFRFADSLGGALALIVVGSLMVAVQGIISCIHQGTCPASDTMKAMTAWGVAAGLISAILCALVLILMRFSTLPGKARFYLAMFLFLWWTAGFGVLTFAGPPMYSTVSNGYFCTWGCFALSASILHEEFEGFRVAVERARSNYEQNRILVVLLAANAVVIFSAIQPCTVVCDGLAGYAIAVGTISFFVVLLLRVAKERIGDRVRYFAGILLLLWAITTGICTFAGPFQQVGNGYFACYISLVASGLLLQSAM